MRVKRGGRSFVQPKSDLGSDGLVSECEAVLSINSIEKHHKVIGTRGDRAAKRAVSDKQLRKVSIGHVQLNRLQDLKTDTKELE